MRPKHMRSRLIVMITGFAMVALAAACGEEPNSRPNDAGGGSTSPDQIYEVTTMVLDDGDGPELCVGGVDESYPPQCGGPEMRGWDWEAVEHEKASGVRWGEFLMRGTYIDGVFTLKEPAVKPQPFEGGGSDIGVPCDEPEGGWPLPDPSLTTEEDRLNATRAAEDEPDFSGVWIDYIVESTDEEEMQPWGENIVLVLAFTGDRERHEAEAREHWGGALCVWEQQERTERELMDIQGDLGAAEEELGFESTFSSIDIVTGVVELGVVVSWPELEAALAERYGAGAVVVRPALHPVD